MNLALKHFVKNQNSCAPRKLWSVEFCPQDLTKIQNPVRAAGAFHPPQQLTKTFLMQYTPLFVDSQDFDIKDRQMQVRYIVEGSYNVDDDKL